MVFLGLIIIHLQINEFMTKLIIASFSLLVVLVLALSCKTTKYTPADFPEDQITFGSGGGFSGIVTDYTLLDNGQMFQRSSTDNLFVELKSASKKATKQMFHNYKFLGIDTLTINAPGNFYYFIQYTGKDSKEDKLVWGADQTPTPENLKLYYSLLSSLIAKK